MEITRAVAETSIGLRSAAAAGVTTARAMSPAVVNEKAHRFNLRIWEILFVSFRQRNLILRSAASDTAPVSMLKLTPRRQSGIVTIVVPVAGGGGGGTIQSFGHERLGVEWKACDGCRLRRWRYAPSAWRGHNRRGPPILPLGSCWWRARICPIPTSPRRLCCWCNTTRMAWSG